VHLLEGNRALNPDWNTSSKGDTEPAETIRFPRFKTPL